MGSNSANNSADMDGQIAYHNEMEHIANRAGDYTKADHHRKMQEIYKAIKEREQLHEISDQLSDGDHEGAGTIADKKILPN
jgi:hypothetical protein